jgi:hypothetical protein
MKSPLQVGLLILCLLGVIGGVTFVAHYSRQSLAPSVDSRVVKRPTPSNSGRPAIEPSLVVYPVAAELGELRVGAAPGQARFWCWSETQERFPLKATSADPCVTVECVPLTAAECQQLVAELAKIARPPQIRSAYRIVVTVYERRDEAMLDLGPFERQVVLHSAPGLDLPALTLTGVVRGDVTIEKEPGGRINLGRFPADRGTRATVRVKATRLDLQPALVGWSPDYLQVGLDEVQDCVPSGERHWRLSVTVPPDRAAGPLPAGSAVVLRLPGTPPRRLRVPLLGTAYR